MDSDADIADIDKPEGIVEAEAGEKIARCFVAESSVAQHATHHVEDGCCGYSYEGGLLHNLVLWGI